MSAVDERVPPKHEWRRADRLGRPDDGVAARAKWAAPWLGMLVGAAVLAPFRDRWFVQVVLLGWMIFAPGRLLLAALRIRRIQVRRFPVYAVAMSLLVIMLTGLAVDGLGVLVGDHHPLRTGPLWTGTAVGYLLILAAAATAPARCRPSLARMPTLRPYWVLALPLLAAAGAGRLNSGRGSTVALVAMFALVAVWLVRPFLPQFNWRTASITVYAASLAGTWSFSLRGDSVYGYDIITEYFIARTTAANGVWHLSHPNDAYGALLSVTVLPTSLHSVAGVALLAVFKAVFPAIFALVPVGILRIAQKLVSVRWAYVAVGLVIGQSFFFDSMPAVARQEIAFVFFVAMIGAMVEVRSRPAISLIVLFAAGMVISHYSSAYMATALTGAALVLALVGRLLRRRPPVLHAAVAFVALLGCSLLWFRALTHSSSNLTQVIDTIQSQGLDILPHHTSNIISSFINGNVGSTLTPSKYASAIAQFYAEHVHYVHPLPGAAAYRLRAAPATPSGAGSVGAIGSDAVSVVGQLINVFAVIGSLALTFGRKGGRTARTLGMLGLGVLGFVAVIRLSGTVAAAYNQERAQIQAFMILSPIAAFVAMRLVTAIGSRRGDPGAAAIATVAALVGAAASALLVANSAGVLAAHPSLNGSANVSAGGEDVARFELLTPDLMAADWLDEANPHDQLTYADAYGQLRLVAARGDIRGIAADITPQTIQPGSWVYAYSQNVVDRTARSSFDGNNVIYRFPRAYLDANFDKVYVNGSAIVFR